MLLRSGGFWAWDPVENASLLPWLTGTAYIHSVMVQERRGMLRVWNLSLLVSTFSLTILGTFLTRSGVVNSVHAFSDSTIGPYLLGAFGVIVAVSLGLIAWRGDRLRSPGAIDSPISREGAFLANNVLFSLFAFVILLGTVFPLIVEAKDNRQIAVGSPFFDTMAAPIGLVLLFLMAIAPVLPWRKAGTELLRTRLFWPAWCGALALVAAVLLGATGFQPLLAFTLAGFAAVIGHCFPVWLRFNGGKGVATTMGVALGLGWPIGLAYALVWIGVLLATRISSLGGLCAVIAAPLAALAFGYGTYAPVLAALALLVVWLHRANIARLRAGTEPRIGSKG